MTEPGHEDTANRVEVAFAMDVPVVEALGSLEDERVLDEPDLVEVDEGAPDSESLWVNRWCHSSDRMISEPRSARITRRVRGVPAVRPSA
jgi:hypothetical protein